MKNRITRRYAIREQKQLEGKIMPLIKNESSKLELVTKLDVIHGITNEEIRGLESKIVQAFSSFSDREIYIAMFSMVGVNSSEENLLLMVLRERLHRLPIEEVLRLRPILDYCTNDLATEVLTERKEELKTSHARGAQSILREIKIKQDEHKRTEEKSRSIVRELRERLGLSTTF